MSPKRPPFTVIIIVLLAILGLAGYYIWQNLSNNSIVKLTASGTIESTSSSVAPELAGKVSEVLVDEGQKVQAGDVIMVLDGSVLKAQREQASAALDTAISVVDMAQSALDAAIIQYDIVLQSRLQADLKTRIEDWKQSKPGEFDQPGWFFTRDEQLNIAQNNVTNAEIVLKEKQNALSRLESKISTREFLAIEKELLEARKEYQITKDVLDLANKAVNYSELHDAAQDRYDDAKDRLYDAQDAYDDALTSDQADDVLDARAELRVAQETYDTALDYARRLQTGMYSLELSAAQTGVDQARASLAQAQASVKQAQATLNLLDTQIKLLTVSSPLDGVILTRQVEPGEVINAGYGAFSIADLSQITITVYVPEDRIGEVSLNQKVTVNVDSFPSEVFTAVVIHISDEAEFTPRNVQTVEGRKNTVFAVKLQVDNTEGKLKPGMPADVIFQ